ncbi:hypothetical protein AWM75_03790 [Aerococcus urinaehominis]|uniref:Calcineurin-like phosphoesterase domain-containing protein n=1 Tax=Aerococcus urinaehominis TaxID=128944 RepID=A0A0X8FKW0_9LACT|nr:metallophosphoesterase [Aerococcus urinaehominis]AMB99180.1 hypothetical protein AWM75_03790 [Aerococcus urinaehominis]SDM06525.1 hypothetical protein SAMN04487985_104117 [Aerococcus urinaehominis]
MAKQFKKLAFKGAVLAAGLAYLYQQNFKIKTSHYFVENPHFTGGLDGLRIAQLSDLHFPKQRVASQEIIDQVAQARPDLIFMTGDIIQGDQVFDEKELFNFAKALVDLAPVFAVYGNHEAGSALARRMESVLSAAGVTFLNDQAVSLEFAGDPITIMGLLEKPNRRFLQGDALRYIQLSPEQIGQPKLLLAHHPEAFLRYHEDMAKSPDLVFTGHAHGGQIRLPGLGGLFAPGQGEFPKYTAGLFHIPGQPQKQIVVSRGIGASAFPVRINNQPELVVVDLTPAKHALSQHLQDQIDQASQAAGAWSPSQVHDYFDRTASQTLQARADLNQNSLGQSPATQSVAEDFLAEDPYRVKPSLAGYRLDSKTQDPVTDTVADQYITIKEEKIIR